MKTFNESKYRYVGLFQGNHVFENTKFPAEKVLIDCAQYNLTNGQIIHFDTTHRNESTISSAYFKRLKSYEVEFVRVRKSE